MSDSISITLDYKSRAKLEEIAAIRGAPSGTVLGEALLMYEYFLKKTKDEHCRVYLRSGRGLNRIEQRVRLAWEQ